MAESAWSDVDRSAQPARFVAGLDRLRAEPFFVEQKARLSAGLALRGDGVRVDRVLQHLSRGADAVGEWKRVLRPGGRVAVFEPDLTTARIDGVDARAAEAVAAWRVSTRPGAQDVRSLADVLARAGFADVRVGAAVLELDDLGRADGIMGLADWGEAAANAGALDGSAARWRDEVQAAWRLGSLRYTCSYVLGLARVA